jgi:hypothetical protein
MLVAVPAEFVLDGLLVGVNLWEFRIGRMAQGVVQGFLIDSNATGIGYQVLDFFFFSSLLPFVLAPVGIGGMTKGVSNATAITGFEIVGEFLVVQNGENGRDVPAINSVLADLNQPRDSFEFVRWER